MKRHSRSVTMLALALLVSVSAGCRETGAGGVPAEISRLPHGALLVRNARPSDNKRFELPAVEVTRIGSLDGPDVTVFGRITGVELSTDGRIFVVDGQSSQVRAFLPDGTLAFTFGRSGGGPGEFRDPRGIVRSPAGTLWIMDRGNQRYTEISEAGELLATYPRMVPTFGTNWEGRFDHAGMLYDAATLASATGTQHLFIGYTVVQDDILPADTFRLPASTEAAFHVRAPFGLLYLPVPFAPQVSWAFDGDDGVWTGDGESFRVRRQNLRGDTTLVVELDMQRLPVTSFDRQFAVTDLTTTLQDVGAPVSIDFGRIPAEHPAFGRLLVDDRQHLWVARPDVPHLNREGVRSTFDVFSPEGVYIGHVTLPLFADRPVAFRGDLVAGITLSDDDVPQVVVHRVSIPAAGR
jgi:hypothetical protein